MKREELIKRLTGAGCAFVRSGARHDEMASNLPHRNPSSALKCFRCLLAGYVV